MTQLELNGRTYLLVLLIGLGLLFEGLKHLSFPATSVTPHDDIFYAKPYAVSETAIRAVPKRPAPRPMPQTSVQLTAPPETAPPAFDMKTAIDKWQKEQTKAVQDAKVKEARKKWHWVWNKKEHKWDWKKKKKKKPATAVSTTPAASDDLAETHAPDPAPPVPYGPAGSPINTLNEMNAVPQAAVPANSAAASKFLTMQEWENLLLTKPNPAETAAFVAAYKQHIVSSQMFYQIVGMMLKSSNSGVQQQGVSALGQTPSVQSFDALAQESQTLQTSSPLYQSVNANLNAYSQAPNLQYLQQVLAASSQTPQELTVALNQLQTAMQTAMQTPGTAGKAGSLTGFIPALTTLSTNSNPAIASEAGQMLAQLQSAGGPTGGVLGGGMVTGNHHLHHHIR